MILQSVERRHRIHIALDIVARVEAEDEILVVQLAVQLHHALGHIAVYLLLVLVQEFDSAPLDYREEFPHTLHHLVVAGGGVAVAVEEGEHADVAALHELCYLHQLGKLSLLLFEALFVVYAYLAYRRTYGRKLYPLPLQHGIYLVLEFFEGVVRDVFPVQVAGAHISFAQLMHDADLGT